MHHTSSKSYLNLTRFLNGYFIMVLASLCMAIGIVFTPVVLNIYAIFVFSVLTSIGMSAYETIANVAVLQMWGIKSESVLQFVHFWYCTGSAVLPFIMEPFLNEVHLNFTDSLVNSTNNETVYPDIKFISGTSITYISIPYFLIGGFLVLILIFTLATVPPSFLKSNSSKQQNTIKSEGRFFRTVMLLFLFFFNFFYIGLQISLLTFLYSFGISDAPGMGLSKQEAVNLTSTMMFSIVIGQFSAIFMSRKFAPTVILVVDITGILTSALIMSFLPLYGNSAPVIFWIASGTTGFFIAPVYGTTFLWAERYITVNASAASIFIIGGSVGEMLLPLPIGLLIDDHPLSFVYIFLGYIIVITVIFVTMWKYASRKGERSQRDGINKKEHEEITS